jgi:hypothetical protein
MVTRKPAFEKQEHAPLFTFELAGCPHFDEPSAPPGQTLQAFRHAPVVRYLRTVPPLQ